MVSERQQAAARANGAKSRGPKTEAGKRRSSQNSLKHGMYASTAAIPGEPPQLLAEDAASLMSALRPDDSVGQALVRIVATAGRLRTRLDEWEIAALNQEIDRQIAAYPELDPATHASLAYRALAPSGLFSFTSRYGSRFDRQIDRALGILLKQRFGERLTIRDRSNLLRLLPRHLFPALPEMNASPEMIKMKERTPPTSAANHARLTPALSDAAQVQSAKPFSAPPSEVATCAR